MLAPFFTVSKTCLCLPWCRRWLTFDLFARSAARVHYHSPQSSLHWPRHVVSDLDATTKHLAVTHQELLIEKGFIGNKCTRTLIYLKRYMVHGFMQCPHISWFARLDQYQAVCCIAIHGRRTAFKKKTIFTTSQT